MTTNQIEDSIFSSDVPALLKEHFEHLKASAISVEVMRERGYRSILGGRDKRLETLGFSSNQQRGGILIPIWGVDGTIVNHVLRPDKPRKNGADKPIKYEQPKGTKVKFDVPPRCFKNLKDPKTPLWIVEGIKKADALATAGAPCVIGLTGVWGFRGTNDLGGKTAIADWDFVALNGRIVYIIFDSDMWRNENVKDACGRLKRILELKGAEVHIIKLQDGENDKKIGADDYLALGHTLDNILALETVELPKTVIRQKLDDFYSYDVSGFYLIKSDSHGTTELPMANFIAKIVENVTRDNGQTTETKFKVSGVLTLTKERLPLIEVPAGSNFNSLSWVNAQWGSKPYIYGGIARNIKESFINKIYDISREAVYKTVYTHTGWRQINGEMQFLTGGGALGNPGINVDIEHVLSRYRLEIPTADPVEAVRASLDYMMIGRTEEQQKILTPLWASMYLAPLCEILDPAFTIWIYGPSGSFKSVISALALSHFGDFTEQGLPSSWHDTANRIEQLMFLAKDLPLVVDDWAPGQNPAKAQDLESKAEYITRAQGNHQGKGRMVLDSIGRPVYTPRGLLITSGEQLPNGQSFTARLFSIKIERDDIDKARLTAAQNVRRLYSQAMAYYVLWLKGRWPEFAQTLPEKFQEYRAMAYDLARENDQHPRLPQVVAWLYTGLSMGLTFALEKGAISKAIYDLGHEDGWRILSELAAEQGKRVEKERPGKKVLESLKAVINSFGVRTWEKDEKTKYSPVPGTTFIGWEDTEFYYLIPKTTYAAVRAFCQHTGEMLTWKEDAVWEDLIRLKHILPGPDRSTKVIWIPSEEKTIRAIWLKKSAVFDEKKPEENSTQ
jgi:hypothetical protein